jgi:hypothetical protein
MMDDEAGRGPLPQVIFLGPLKTGTTWIHEYLLELGKVVLPKGTKETFFFDRYYERGLSFYEGFFPAGLCQDGDKVLVEVAPSYGGAGALVLERIAADLSDVTVVITMRDPVDRTLSQYWHEVRYGYYTGPIEDHLCTDDEIIRRSDYPTLVADALRIFGTERVKILDFAELQRDPRQFCARVCSCLGIQYVPPSETLVSSVSNEGRVPRLQVMARLATRVVDLLKRHGLYLIPQIARRLGLRRLLERPSRINERAVSEEHRAVVRALLRYDYESLLSSLSDLVPPPAEGFLNLDRS